MNITSKKASLIILGLTSIVCSRAVFALFSDPEGPNLLIVTVMAVVLYTASLVAYKYSRSSAGLKKLLLAICTQIIVALGLYLFLK